MQEAAHGLVYALQGMATAVTLEQFFLAYTGYVIFVTLVVFAPIYALYILAEIGGAKIPKHLLKVRSQIVGWNLWAAALPFLLIYYAVHGGLRLLRSFWTWVRS